jgi:hypothetical protein
MPFLFISKSNRVRDARLVMRARYEENTCILFKNESRNCYGLEMAGVAVHIYRKRARIRAGAANTVLYLEK